MHGAAAGERVTARTHAQARGAGAQVRASTRGPACLACRQRPGTVGLHRNTRHGLPGCCSSHTRGCQACRRPLDDQLPVLHFALFRQGAPHSQRAPPAPALAPLLCRCSAGAVLGCSPDRLCAWVAALAKQAAADQPPVARHVRPNCHNGRARDKGHIRAPGQQRRRPPLLGHHQGLEAQLACRHRRAGEGAGQLWVWAQHAGNSWRGDAGERQLKPELNCCRQLKPEPSCCRSAGGTHTETAAGPPSPSFLDSCSSSARQDGRNMRQGAPIRP